MKFRTLGHSGLRISEIAYGNWLTHGSQVEAEQARACVEAAIEHGITTFDTADVYANTRAESILGDILKDQRREALQIFTKVYWPCAEDVPSERLTQNDSGLSRKHILESINGSLRRLRTDYVDLYQAHRYDTDTPLEETMLAFADVVRAGKALYIGVSEWSADQIRAAKGLADELRVPLISNQPQYNMLWRVIEDQVVPTCHDLGMSQIVWSPIGQGLLTGKYQPGQEPPAGSRASHDAGAGLRKRLVPDVLERIQRLRPLADEAGLSMAALAVAWTLQNPNVAAAIIGASRPEQVTENVQAAGVQLDPELMGRIDDILGDAVQRDPALTRSPQRLMELHDA